MKDLPCNIVAYYTTRPLCLRLGIPLYWGKMYVPHLMIFPLILGYVLGRYFIGCVFIILFGGIAIILGKSDELRNFFFPEEGWYS